MGSCRSKESESREQDPGHNLKHNHVTLGALGGQTKNGERSPQSPQSWKVSLSTGEDVESFNTLSQTIGLNKGNKTIRERARLDKSHSRSANCDVMYSRRDIEKVARVLSQLSYKQELSWTIFVLRHTLMQRNVQQKNSRSILRNGYAAAGVCDKWEHYNFKLGNRFSSWLCEHSKNN